jgi:hypothetical protein
MHTYDNVNLLGLSNLVLKRDGTALEICLPDATVDGPLFAAMKDIHEK